MSSRVRSPSFSDDSTPSSRETHNRDTVEEEHDFDENTSTDSRMLYYFPSWSVIGRRGRKVKEPTVSTAGFEHVRNSYEAESKDSNSTTILSNVIRDKGKSIIMTDETSEEEMRIKGLEIKNLSGSVVSNNNNSIFRHQMVPLRLEKENINLDLSLCIATASNVSTSHVISAISSAVDKGRSIMDETEGKIKKVSEKVGDEKAHVCKLCGKLFSKHEALGGHMSTCHPTRKSKEAKGCQALGCQSSTAEGDRVEESHKLHECNICHRVFGTGQQLGGHKRAHYEGSLGTSSSKRAKYSTHGSSSTGTTAVREACDVSSSESIVDKAPVAASSSEAVETNTSAAAATASRSAVLGIDLNEIPPDEE